MPDVAAAPERTLPHNLDAEKSVLGAILIHNDAFNHAAELIDSHDFFRDAHRRIFDKMVALSERGDAIDFITLKEELSRAGELDEVGGPSYIAALADGVPRSANVEYYARIVKEKSTLRSLIHSANKILTEAYEAEQEPEVLLDEAERSIFAIAEGRIRDGFVPLRDLVQSSFATIEKLQQNKGAITGVPSGFPDLDEMTTGFHPGDLVVVAARPSMGKTSFVLNIAQHVGTHTAMTVGFFSLEMSKEQLFMRMLTSEARIDAHRFRSGFLNEKDYGKPVARARHARGSPRVHRRHRVDRRARDARQGAPAQGRARPRPADHRLPAADAGARPVREPAAGSVGDLPIAEGPGQGARAARSSRCRSSVARPEGRTDHRPQLSDLRESGAIEQDADVVMFIYRPEVYDKEEARPEDQGIAEIIIGKQRNGPIGTVKLSFLNQYTRFENLAHGAQ